MRSSTDLSLALRTKKSADIYGFFCILRNLICIKNKKLFITKECRIYETRKKWYIFFFFQARSLGFIMVVVLSFLWAKKGTPCKNIQICTKKKDHSPVWSRERQKNRHMSAKIDDRKIYLFSSTREGRMRNKCWILTKKDYKMKTRNGLLAPLVRIIIIKKGRKNAVFRLRNWKTLIKLSETLLFSHAVINLLARRWSFKMGALKNEKIIMQIKVKAKIFQKNSVSR